MVLLFFVIEKDAVLHVPGLRVPCPHGNVFVRILYLSARDRRAVDFRHGLRCNAAGSAASLGDNQTGICRHRNAAIVGAHFQKDLVPVLVALGQIRILPGRLGVGRCTDGVSVADIEGRVHGIDGAVNLVADFDLISQLGGWVEKGICRRKRLILNAVQHGIEVVADTLTGIGAVIHRDFKSGVIALGKRISFLVRHGDLGHLEPPAGRDLAAHHGNMNDARRSFNCAGLVVDQRKAVCRDDSVELMVNDRIDFLGQGTDTAAGFRGLGFSVATGQLPRQRIAVTGNDVVIVFIHDTVGFRGRCGQRHQPQHSIVRDGPVAAVARAYPS